MRERERTKKFQKLNVHFLLVPDDIALNESSRYGIIQCVTGMDISPLPRLMFFQGFWMGFETMQHWQKDTVAVANVLS